VRILPKNSGFGCFDAKARQNRPVEAPWRAFGFKTALELCVCKPLGVGSSLNQDSKWKFRLNAFVGESFEFADFCFAYGAGKPPRPAIVSTIKARQAGFHDCMDTEDMFRKVPPLPGPAPAPATLTPLCHPGRNNTFCRETEKST
jgi:hypothetical protein